MPRLLLPIIYLAFVALGLPDSLLGSAWPAMHVSLGTALESQGLISMLIAGCTIVSSLATDHLQRAFGTGRLTAASVGLTAVALAGLSTTTSLWQVCLWAVPYGLGAGAVDASLNGYVALHYQASHMSWLHCSWGIGASLGPMVMGACLARMAGWQAGYLTIGAVQAVLAGLLVVTLPLWKAAEAAREQPGGEGVDAPQGIASRTTEKDGSPTGPQTRQTRSQLLKAPGTWQVMAGFLCYTALEAGCGLWGATYVVQAQGADTATAASLVSLFYVGITLGRLVSGFLTLRLDATSLLHLGQALAAMGVLLLMLGSGVAMMGVALFLIGLGCAPIYPTLLQQTPARFGSTGSQSMMGLQMACAYAGTTLFPPLAGLLLGAGATWAYPTSLLTVTFLMALCVTWGDHLIDKDRHGRTATDDKESSC
ncbi:MAG: MFS transporter [Atopobiaceae bacterium]|jgi:fucose permease|nr:MFS transporter [Atopobiaceae bacterium]MCH4180526.1 MFS transporter [Atopobiaceae bacterium]MCH4214251.1 MFS transporter [Atopobiaceae bacterium]MCH4229452.1 MFS transporter [Atopobiaceae bacterium]MCH4276076.1 MFS transporter [Atopobiaceae bacterium]